MSNATFDLDALMTALDAKRRAEDISWRKVAEQVGVSASTLTRMGQGANPDLESFSKLVTWLEEPADQFITKPGRSKKTEAPGDLRVVVSRHLRASKELSPESAKALEGILEAAYKQMRGLKR